MGQILTLFIALTSGLAIASGSESSKQMVKIEISGIGIVHILEEDLWEPIAAPTRIEVKIKCAKTKTSEN